MNEYTFLRVYTDLAHQRVNENELEDLYWLLKDKSQGSHLEKYFGEDKPIRLDWALATDAIAHAIHQTGDEALQVVFPGANNLVMKSALDELSGYEAVNEVRKFNRGYFTTLLDQDEGILFLEKQQVGRTTKEDISDAISEYETLVKAGLASPAEILTLSRYYDDGRYAEMAKDIESSMVVGGPASIEMIDKQSHLITSEALDKAFTTFIKSFRTRNIQVLHSNVQTGWALPAYINENGEVFKSGVDDKGLWLISELRNDIRIAKRVQDAIEDGKIRSYSIAGSATDIQNMQKGSQTFMQVNELELAEVTLCEKGVNQGAHFDILKSDDMVDSAEVFGSIDTEEIIKSIPDSLPLLQYGVVLEKSTPPRIVICADKANSLTDALFTMLRKEVPASIAIEVRAVPEAEWEPLLNFQATSIVKDDSIELLRNANYRPARTDTTNCGHCEFFGPNDKCTKFDVTVNYDWVCDIYKPKKENSVHKRMPTSFTEEFIGKFNLGIGNSYVDLASVIGGATMVKSDSKKLNDFLQWEKGLKERRKLNKDLLEYKGIPSDEKDFDITTEQPDGSKDYDYETTVKTLKDLQKPSEG